MKKNKNWIISEIMVRRNVESVSRNYQVNYFGNLTRI